MANKSCSTKPPQNGKVLLEVAQCFPLVHGGTSVAKRIGDFCHSLHSMTLHLHLSKKENTGEHACVSTYCNSSRRTNLLVLTLAISAFPRFPPHKHDRLSVST
jgi:hypothetical protein